MITQDELKESLSYNKETGIFIWIKPRQGITVGSQAGCIDTRGYMALRVNGKQYKLHRLAWLYVYGEWPQELDHINHNRLDNRIENLRCVTRQENGRNLSLNKNNTSGVTGVRWNIRERKWRAKIHVNNKHLHLGCYSEFIDAVKARKSAEVRYGYHENHGMTWDELNKAIEESK